MNLNKNSNSFGKVVLTVVPTGENNKDNNNSQQKYKIYLILDLVGIYYTSDNLKSENYKMLINYINY